ncbi:TIGR02391 family protein [Comamonas terrigena]|uniref:TIGR02391 family protein n=1 Tax=Comamonas terrigena TaxID=32013 RepID=UPI00244853BE|nr:TIGR02391 family protein [Comamonas terrigena]MDH1700303.1 TIGR02391 family protein [Comamonas terrigena]
MKIQDLLEKPISDVSWKLFKNQNFRESMINAIICLFDLIRNESGLQEDGSSLVGKAFAIENPRIILADLQTESGKNIQKGNIQILQGYFQAYRNIAAHSLKHKFDAKDTLSVLIAVSRLYEKIQSAEKGIFLRHDGIYFNNDEESNTHKYLRFYEDETVISVSTISEGEHSEIVNWFNKDNAEDFKLISHGKYEITGRKIKFQTTSSYGTVEYEGIIRSKILHIKTKSLINGHISEADYKFISRSNIRY